MAISPGAPQEPLPVASNEYDPENERMTRRSIEFGLEELGNEVFIAKTQGDKEGSLSMRRFQLLLMGAS